MESLVVARQKLRNRATGASVERTALRNYISDYSSLLAPIRRLTHDMLERVFADPEISQMIRIGRIAPPRVAGCNPYILASVSYYWMCVALQSHELWSKFAINACGDGYALSQMRACLQRSGALPLSIDLTLSAIDFGSSPSRPGCFLTGPCRNIPTYVGGPFDGDILKELMFNAERWSQLWITMPKENIALLAPVHGRLHKLQEITFHFDVAGLGNPASFCLVDFELRGCQVRAADCARFAALRPASIDFWRLTCLDASMRLVEIQ
ncbi:hypothetical protein DFH06DRAFT_1172920 [Mycena polygramma]|nr:hypothetical protein DFH06DRAFT_1172920 [Mycena polygramma]